MLYSVQWLQISNDDRTCFLEKQDVLNISRVNIVLSD